MTVRCAAVLWGTLAGCGFGHDVGHDGSYVVVPSTPVIDTAPYPLETLLIVEQALEFDETRLYLFTGELGRAGLGFSDLRRIAAGHGGFQMAFDPVREPVDDEKVPSRSPPLQAIVGEQEIALKRLDDRGLQASGASRYLSTAISPDFRVRAYFAVLDELAPIAIARRDVDFASELEDPELALRRDEGQLGLDYHSDADYVVVEVGQVLFRKDPERTPIQALVRTSLAPGTPYAMGSTLLTNVAGQGCWSRGRTITARLTQVSRRYVHHDEGDWAVVHRRIDAIEIGVDGWTDFLEELTPSDYCKDFE